MVKSIKPWISHAKSIDYSRVPCKIIINQNCQKRAELSELWSNINILQGGSTLEI